MPTPTSPCTLSSSYLRVSFMHRQQVTGRRQTACTTCHSRKVKCDTSVVGIPCSKCAKASRNDCQIHQPKRRHRRSAVPASPIAITPSHPDSRRLPNVVQDGTPLLAEPFTSTQGHAGQGKTHLVEFVEQPSLEGRPIDRNARVTYIGTAVSNLNFLTMGQRLASQSDTTCHHPTNRIARQHTAHEPDRLPADALQLPGRILVEQLLDSYFDHVNTNFPVVDEDEFRAQYLARDSQNPPSLLLLQAILMVGAHMYYEEANEREPAKAMFFRRAKALFDGRFERNRDVVVQAALLLTWHVDGLEDVAANGWWWTRTAGTIALGLGMHRNAEPSTLVPMKKRMWRRVFWLLFTCDVQQALQHGRPQAIRLDECDVLPLQGEDFLHCGPNTQADYVTHSARLSIVASEALRAKFGPSSKVKDQTQAIADADGKLATWAVDLPEHLQLRPTLSLNLTATILQLEYNALLIQLHRPTPPGTLNYGARPDDADICSAAASHIQALVEAVRERGSLRRLPGFTVNILYTAMIQLGIEVRLANPVLAVAARRRFSSALACMRSLSDTWPYAEPIAYFFERQNTRTQMAIPSAESDQDVTMNSLVTNTAADGATEGSMFTPSGMATEFENWRQLFTSDPQNVAAPNLESTDRDIWQGQYWTLDLGQRDSLDIDYDFPT